MRGAIREKFFEEWGLCIFTDRHPIFVPIRFQLDRNVGRWYTKKAVEKKGVDNTMPEQGVMTASQVADYLGVSTQAVYRLSQQGKIPAQKVGRVWRYPKAAVDEWLHGFPRTRAVAKRRVPSGATSYR